jgi:hypothetical protein
MAVVDDIFDNLATSQMEAIRVERTLERRVRAQFRTLFREIAELLRANNPMDAQRIQTQRRRLQELIDNNIAPAVEAQIDTTREQVKESIALLAGLLLAATLRAINRGAGEQVATTLPNEAALRRALTLALVPIGDQEATLDDWLDRIQQRTIERIGDEIRRGIERQDDVERIITNLLGTRGTRFQDGIQAKISTGLAALIATYANTALNEARIATYEANADYVKAVRHVSILDSRTSAICIARSGGRYRVPGFEPIPPTRLPFLGGPPYHFRCRSTIVPDVRRGEGLQEPTFEEFLRRQPEEQQRAILGARRFELWRDGKLSLVDLIDAATGQPLTLQELRSSLS